MVLTLALQCQGFCGEDDHYRKVPKVTVANSTHLRVSWHGLFSGCNKSEILKMGAVSSHTTLLGETSIKIHWGLDFDEKEGYLALNPCLEHEVYLELASHNEHIYRMSKMVMYNDVSRPNIASLYGGLLPDENYMGSVCLKQKGVITFPDPPEALSECILTRGDQVTDEEFTDTGHTHFVWMKILHPTNEAELEITAPVKRIIDCTQTTTKPTPTTDNQNTKSPTNDQFSNETSSGPHIPHAFHILLGLASIPVCMTIIGLVYMFWTNPIKCKCCNKRESSMKMDINSDVYGPYSRGEDGEGECGDGDKVYVQDSNDYYGS